MKTLRQRLVELSTQRRAHAACRMGDDDDVGGVILCSGRAEPRFYGRARGSLQRCYRHEHGCEY